MGARSLVEALLVQFFWKMLGIEDSVDSHYLMHSRTQLDWIRIALRNVWLMRVAASDRSVAIKDMKDALHYWVFEQADWYQRKADKQASSVIFHKKISRIALWTAIAGAAVIPASLLVLSGSCSMIAQGQHYAAPQTLLYRILHFVITVPAL
ncbi:MAG: hypothetical protein P4K97_08120 [Terracidiphilus sp.]|nr:hypothetical protein [Terracidiphilus sp.]